MLNMSRKILFKPLASSILLSCFLFNTIIFSKGFVAGTPVLTPNGYVPIEEIKEGDKVICSSSWDGKRVTATVGKTRKETIEQTVKITIDEDAILEASPDQKLCDGFRSGEGWKEMRNFNNIRSDGNCLGEIYGQHRKCPPCTTATKVFNKTTEVYDLHVRYHHNYIVTEKEVYAHNFFPAVLNAVVWVAANFELCVGIVGLPLFIGSIVFKKLTNKEAKQKAFEWDFVEDKSPPFNSHGQPVFKHKKRRVWITPDADGHNGGVWKEYKGGKRTGTLDENGKPIGK
jgi:Novel toxin 21